MPVSLSVCYGTDVFRVGQGSGNPSTASADVLRVVNAVVPSLLGWLHMEHRLVDADMWTRECIFRLR